MKNITVSVDDESYLRARVEAARRNTSVSALVKQFLAELSQSESEFERLKRAERALRDEIKSFSAADRLGRDELHHR